jgi:hypothetical protein
LPPQPIPRRILTAHDPLHSAIAKTVLKRQAAAARPVSAWVQGQRRLRLEAEVTVSVKCRVIPCVLSLVVSLTGAATASATSLVHSGIETLARDNETILQASVLGIHSYWDAGHTFILTDVLVRPSKRFKGDAPDELSFTVMGGSVDGITTLIVGGPELVPGSEYVLFLSRTDLPGAAARLTVRDLCQGVFTVRHGRAFSEALGEPLLPDARGDAEVPGGADGLPLETLGLKILESR